MNDLGYDWRQVRCDDLQGSLVGMRFVADDPAYVEVVVATGTRAGMTLRWTKAQMPPGLWKAVGSRGLLLGRIDGPRLDFVSTEERAEIRRVARGGEPSQGEFDSESMLMVVGADGSMKITDGPDGSARGEAAATYTTWGWAVFPLVPGGKNPHRGSHGWKDARAGAQFAQPFREYYAAWPSDNLALACGQGISPVVLDIDPRNGGSIEAAEQEWGCSLDSGWRVATPSGGFHCYFYDRAQDDHTRLPSVDSGVFDNLPGVEIKARGRYVVMPPSTMATGEGYEWVDRAPQMMEVPAQMRTAAHDATHKPRSAFLPGTDDNLTWIDPDLLVESLASAVPGNSDRGRNATLHAATREACYIYPRWDGTLPDVIERLRATALNLGLPEREVEKAINSAATHVLGPQHGLAMYE